MKQYNLRRKKAGIEDEQYSTAEEAVPLKVLAGQQKVAVTWISGLYRIQAYQAPNERPAGKK